PSAWARSSSTSTRGSSMPCSVSHEVATVSSSRIVRGLVGVTLMPSLYPSGPTSQVAEPLLLVLLDDLAQQVLDVAVQDPAQPVDRDPDAVVGAAVLGEVVGAD